MSTKRNDEEKVEAYTRALLDAARKEGRTDSDLIQWQHARKFSPEVLETLTTMYGQDDLTLVEKVARQYKELVDAGDDTVLVSVTTAVPLDERLRAKVKNQAEAELGKPVYLVEHVSPDILGGIVLEARGKRYDVSVRAQLANIRKTLTSTFIGGDKNE
jgi:F-type H+-transporting ATPase subunit delta